MSIKIDCLFETQALSIAPPDALFWYTSGLLGPYYINTEKLCGGEKTAKSILAFIDKESGDKKNFPAKMLQTLHEAYEAHAIFRDVIAALTEEARRLLHEFQCAYISGGERRDWFFAPLVAEKLQVPMLYVYNDKSVIDEQGEPVLSLNGNVMNIADLLTVGSSYVDKWVPAMQSLGAKLSVALNVMDRSQGGVENLQAVGVQHCAALFTVNEKLFADARERHYISAEQEKMLCHYFEDQVGSMRSWLQSNESFLQAALQSDDAKTRQRAQKLVSENLYGLH